MASVPKGEMKADIKAEVKQEPKEQREPKKPNTPVQMEKPSSPKSSPGSVRKENSPKKENSPAKTTEQKSPDKKDVKEAVAAVKKENSTPPKNQEQPKSPDVKKKESPEKNESPAKDKATAQHKAADVKPSSPDKNASAKPNDKVSSPGAANSPANGSTQSQEASANPAVVNAESPKSGSSPQNAKAAKQEASTNNQSPNGNSDSKKKEQGGEKGSENTPKPTNTEESKTKPESVKEEKPLNKPEKDEGTEKIDKDLQTKKKQADSEKTSKDTSKTDIKEKKEQSNDKNNNESGEVKKEEVSPVTSPSQKNGKHDSKNQLRSEIWNKMFRSSMLAFRKPCNYRIPHFKGDVISAGRLSTLEIFQNAKVVKVSLDKAHECVRLQVIEAGKEMIVGCPGLREAVFLHVKPPMEPSKSSNRLASSRIGIGHVGTALDFTSGTQADLVIVGSVAVDRTGLRVGKGEGFADLEYALLKKLGGIAPNAPIVTVVHDSQVYDTLPENLFKEHDVPADYIVTPTEVIEISPKRKHPDLIWNILSNRRVNSIPIIKQLLDREQNRDGATNISLKEEDTDSEELEQIAKRKRYFMRRRTYSNGSPRGRGQMVNRNNNQGNMNMRGGRTRRHTAPSERTIQEPRMMMMMPQNRPTRTFRSRAASMTNYDYPQQNMKQNGYWAPRNFQNGSRRRNNRLQMLRPKYSVDFSLKVQGLTNEIRVRDLKAAVIQRGIRPRDISWLPHKGMAFLHFVKQKNNMTEQQQTAPMTNTDSVLASLKDLIVKAENGPETNVKVEAAQPFRKVHFTV